LHVLFIGAGCVRTQFVHAGREPDTPDSTRKKNEEEGLGMKRSFLYVIAICQ